jgi:hypothetical protein
VVVYPLSTARLDEPRLREALVAFGLTCIVDRERVTRAWRRLKSQDDKHVEVHEWRDPLFPAELHRVDVFFLS